MTTTSNSIHTLSRSRRGMMQCRQSQSLPNIPLVHLAVIPMVALRVQAVAWTVGALPATTAPAFSTIHRLQPVQPAVDVAWAPGPCNVLRPTPLGSYHGAPMYSCRVDMRPHNVKPVLDGIRVVELADEQAEYCGMVLAGLGRTS